MLNADGKLTGLIRSDASPSLRTVKLKCDFVFSRGPKQLYRSEIYYRSPIDGTHWLPNKEMTTLWEASVTIHIPSSPARAGTIRDRAERPTPHEARKASAS